MANQTLTASRGFLESLTLAFIILKLTHYIDWSWWGVLSPILIVLALLLLAILWAWFYPDSK